MVVVFIQCSDAHYNSESSLPGHTHTHTHTLVSSLAAFTDGSALVGTPPD